MNTPAGRSGTDFESDKTARPSSLVAGSGDGTVSVMCGAGAHAHASDATTIKPQQV
jgi:hypothetical protein